MKSATAIFAVMLVTSLATNATAAIKPQALLAQETSADLLKAVRSEALLLKTAALAVTDVGDPDSFGRNVKYLGLAQTSLISILPDCTPDPSSPPQPNDRCITLPPQPNPTSINENDLASMSLPAKATHSLMCFALTPIATFQFMNNTGVPQSSARFNISASIVIHNDLLNDPSLIDPTTSAPFNGQISLTLSTYTESRSLAVGERAQQGLRLSRNCIGGLISKQALIDNYGLTASQANNFFDTPMKLSFGAIGTTQLTDFAGYMYGIRLYGD